eukprot:5043224-Prorocentrum_lima.AAC.1
MTTREELVQPRKGYHRVRHFLQGIFAKHPELGTLRIAEFVAASEQELGQADPSDGRIVVPD